MNDAERFAQLSKEDLKALAGYFAESDEGTKKDIAERLVDGGVTWDDYKRVSAQDPTAPKIATEEEAVVPAPVTAATAVEDAHDGDAVAAARGNPNDVAPTGVVTTRDLKTPTPESVAAEAEFVKEAPAPTYHEGGLVHSDHDRSVTFYHPGGPITLDAGEYIITQKGVDAGANLLKGLMRHATPQPVKAAPVPEDKILIRMTRTNPSYNVEGVTFSVASPFAVVPRDQGKRILQYPGFREASPSEAEAFFNG